jgi:hypothetical protein
MRKILSAILFLSLQAAPFVQAQDNPWEQRDSTEVQNAIVRLTQFQNDDACSAIRGGGSSGKKLGVYNMGKDLEFHSKEYMELDPAVKARWAVLLYKFIEQKGGGWEAAYDWNMKRAQGDPAANILNASLSAPGSPSTEGLDATFVPYQDVSDWADHFFREYAKDKYSKLGSMYQDWFRNDAILDGINIFAGYQTKNSQDPLVSKVWAEKNIDRYRRRVGKEGKYVGEKKPQDLPGT